MISLEPHANGVVLPVRASAGARASELRKIEHGILKLAVTQVAERGKANDAILALLCQKLNLRKSQIELLSGATNPQKRFLIRDVSAEELVTKLEAALSKP